MKQKNFSAWIYEYKHTKIFNIITKYCKKYFNYLFQALSEGQKYILTWLWFFISINSFIKICEIHIETFIISLSFELNPWLIFSS